MRLILIAGLTNGWGSDLYQNCSLILKFHLLIPQPTNKINAKNRQSKWVYSLVGNEPWMWNRRPDGIVINKYHHTVYILEFEWSSDRNKNFLRVKEDEANEQHRSIIEVLREIIAFPLVLFHSNLFSMSTAFPVSNSLLHICLNSSSCHNVLILLSLSGLTNFAHNLKKNCQKKPIFTNLKKRFEHIESPAKLIDYFLGNNKSNINQS